MSSSEQFSISTILYELPGIQSNRNRHVEAFWTIFHLHLSFVSILKYNTKIKNHKQKLESSRQNHEETKSKKWHVQGEFVIQLTILFTVQIFDAQDNETIEIQGK